MTAKPKLRLRSVHEILTLAAVSPDTAPPAQLHGIITHADGRGGIRFLTLNDGTGSIQLLAARDDMAQVDWEQVNSISTNARVVAEGVVGYSRSRRLSLMVSSVVPQGALTVRNRTGQHTDAVRAQVLLARLRARASTFFASQGFLEIEPRLISTDWQKGELSPLRVDYAGFGIPAYLVPSPASQLFDALLVSGRNRVFCVSRNFTLTYRDTVVGTESTIVSAKMLGADMPEAAEVAMDAVKEIVQEVPLYDSLPASQGWSSSELPWPPSPVDLSVQGPEAHYFKKAVSSAKPEGQPLDVFRLCWPPSLALVEGCHETLGPDVHVSSFTVHMVRFLHLLGPVDTRRLPNLADLLIPD